MERDTCNTALVRLASVAERVANAASADEGLHAVVQAVKDLFNAQTAAVVLLDEHGDTLHLRAARGLTPAFIARFSRPLGTGIVAEVVVSGMALLLPDPAIDREASKDFRLEGDFGSAMAVQIAAGHKPCGYLYCDHAETGRYERTDLQAFRCIATLAALAIEKARLHDEVRRLAVEDGVTGLFTANHFYSRLSHDIARAIRYGETLGVLLFQVEHLAQVEATYGRQAAEDALRYIAALIREHTRGVDYAARHSEDEIIVCLVRSERIGIERVSERIIGVTSDVGSGITVPSPADARKAGAAPEARPLRVAVIVAGAAAPEHGKSVADLTASLQNAMRRARSLGAGRLAVAD
jgi:diguanylate cyclase (GGDEF)-like protein